ncbi:MAG: two-component regulator propeller domain-containing protein, partial [Melioribacteraceae bacterium]|nr:two-component regulator propeller domain-containing protein [Melioribacteraceae bacterium]
LNRYDGYDFTVYRYDPSDTTSISDNFIWAIFEDSKKNIWVGTNNGGLNKYDYKENSFNKYYDRNKEEINNIRVIFEDHEQNLWIGTENHGLYKSNFYDSNFVKIIIDTTLNLSIRAICEDKTGNIWIGSNGNGLYKYNPHSLDISNYNTSNSELESQSIWALERDSNEEIWIGTYKAGLAKYDNDEDKIINISGSNNSSIINDNITSLLSDNQNNLWICTEGGLSIFNKDRNQFVNFKHNPSDLRSLSNSLLRSIYMDNHNLIWIGTLGGGVSKLNLKKKFNQFNHNPSDEYSLSNNIIRAVEEDSKENLWIGTLGSGLNRFERSENRFYRINSFEIGLSSNDVTSIFEDSKKNLWIGTWGGGLNRIKLSKYYKILESERFVNKPFDKNSLSSNIVQDIYEDADGNLWIGTEDGLNLYDISEGHFQRFQFDPADEISISDNRVQSRCIIEDNSGTLWIGTWNGLNMLYTDLSNEIEYYRFRRFYKEQGLSDNRIIALYNDTFEMDSSKQIIWIGTIGGGLNKMILKKNNNEIIDYSFEHYSERNGLPSNVIYGIIGDDQGNLWLSTNNGISKFNIKTEEFRNFGVDDGLQSNQFFWGAFHKTSDNELFFGGINGLNSFFPNQLVENKNIPPVYITKCNIESTNGTFNLVLNSIDEINF